MSADFTIQWTQSARNDLLEIATYMAKDSVDIALTKIELIEKKVNSLKSFPYIGKNVPELEEYNEDNYKQILVYPWRVIYSIAGAVVVILIVIDSRRDLQDILFKKLMK